MARILVIDDDEQMRSMLRQMLERAGHEVVLASNGLEGMRLYRQESTDLIITDIIMPEKEGLQTIRELKTEFPDLKVIAISGGGSKGNMDFLPVAKVFGAKRIVTKPFKSQVMLDIVDDVLEL